MMDPLFVFIMRLLFTRVALFSILELLWMRWTPGTLPNGSVSSRVCQEFVPHFEVYIAIFSHHRDITTAKPQNNSCQLVIDAMRRYVSVAPRISVGRNTTSELAQVAEQVRST